MRTKLLAAACILGIVLIAGIIGALSNSKPTCPTPIGWAYQDSCIASTFPVEIVTGVTTTQCFWFHPQNPYSTLGYMIVTSECGPFAPYASLTYELYDGNCDSLIYSGSIYPTQVNTFILLDTTLTYRICYTWTALCDQTQGCPIINPSFLPLTWLWVDGRVEGAGIRVSWTTASEINVRHFVIEKMCGEWCEIGVVVAGGNTTYSTVYDFLDGNVQPENYYRIKQVDFDGKFSYSKVIIVFSEQRGYSDCYYMTMLGEIISSDISNLPRGIYIKRCREKHTLIPITQ